MKFNSFFCGFIPRHVNNTVVSACYTFMGQLQRLLDFLSRFTSGSVSRHLAATLTLAKNQAAFAKHYAEIQAKGGFIENQHSYSDMTYGRRTMQISGCGIFAVFNALSYLQQEALPDLPDLIRDFEQNGMVLNGIGGTAPRAIQKYLTRNGIPNKYTTRSKSFHTLAAESKCIILTMFNDRNDIRKQMHTICITKQPMPFNADYHRKTGDSGYTAHNVTGNGSVIGPHSSFQELMEHMNGGKSRVFFMIGIL